MQQSVANKHIKNMPKIDLHCHLDGSLTPNFVKETLKLEEDLTLINNKLQAPEICSGLAEYLERFDLPIRCLQTKANITAAIYNVLKDAVLENVKYMEIRFAPAFSLNDTLTYSDIYEAAIAGCKAAQEDFGIYSSIIACAMRHLSEEQNLAVLNSAREYLGNGVCALDLAGDEAAFANSNFFYLFDRAKKIDMPFTIHSGECHSIENVKVALDFGAKRVGHGIALIGDKNLMMDCKKARLGLELCPTSNYQTRAFNADDTYPLRAFLDNGLLATVNTDNRTVSNTTIGKELSLVCDKYNISENMLDTLYKNSVEIAFASDDIKHQLLKFL